MSDIPDWAQAARDSWQWRGSGMPSFAVLPGPSQVSVWDFPRPPKVAFDTREVVVRWGDIEVVRTSRAVLVLEPPTRQPSTCLGQMSPGTCSSRRQADLFANGRGQRNTGRWPRDHAVCRRSPGATLIRCRARSRYQIVSRSTPSRFNAPSGVRLYDRSLAAFMAAGSRLSWWGHSKAWRAVPVGERHAQWCGSGQTDAPDVECEGTSLPGCDHEPDLADPCGVERWCARDSPSPEAGMKCRYR